MVWVRPIPFYLDKLSDLLYAAFLTKRINRNQGSDAFLHFTKGGAIEVKRGVSITFSIAIQLANAYHGYTICSIT